MNKFAPLLAIAVGLPLSGCQSLPLFHFADRHQVEKASSPVSGGTQYVTAGRQQLQDGQLGSAIDSFRVALAVGEDPAAAFNGLGVAYAQLGRPDAAEALFTRAAELQPGNESYARNIARLEASRGPSAQATTEVQPEADVALADAQPGPGQYLRVSPWEVKIKSAHPKPPAGPLPAVASRTVREDVSRADRVADLSSDHPKTKGVTRGLRVAQVDPRFRPLVRVALETPSLPRAARLAARQASTSIHPLVDDRFVSLVKLKFDDIGTTGSGKRKTITLAQR